MILRHTLQWDLATDLLSPLIIVHHKSAHSPLVLTRVAMAIMGHLTVLLEWVHQRLTAIFLQFVEKNLVPDWLLRCDRARLGYNLVPLQIIIYNLSILYIISQFDTPPSLSCPVH